MTRSLTTAATFEALIADLPLTVIERTAFGGIAFIPTDANIDREGLDHLFHALTINARKRGLTARRGAIVWRVNGCAA